MNIKEFKQLETLFKELVQLNHSGRDSRMPVIRASYPKLVPYLEQLLSAFDSYEGSFLPDAQDTPNPFTEIEYFLRNSEVLKAVTESDLGSPEPPPPFRSGGGH